MDIIKRKIEILAVVESDKVHLLKYYSKVKNFEVHVHRLSTFFVQILPHLITEATVLLHLGLFSSISSIIIVE